MRQAYDYWQDQPGNYLREEPANPKTNKLPQDPSRAVKHASRLQVCYKLCDFQNEGFERHQIASVLLVNTACAALSLTYCGLMLATNPVLLTLINFSAAPSPADR